MTQDRFNALTEMAARVKRASRALARTDAATRDGALEQIAVALLDHRQSIFDANEHDLEAARTKGLADAFVDRLALDEARLGKMANAVREVIALPDPLGGVDSMWQRPNGLMVGKKRIPLGAIGIIYESRPNVTSDAAALCLKSGNGVLLKGGSDAFRSNQAIFTAMSQGLGASALPEAARHAIGFVDTTERDAVKHMLGLSSSLDLIIPRGGKGLIRFVSEHSRIPVIKHDEGVCHVVIDGSAPPARVDAIALNAKTQRPGVCNAAETILILESAAENHLPRVLSLLVDANVRIHACDKAIGVARSIGLTEEDVVAASETSWGEEYLALEVALRVVPDLDAAIAHIDAYGSNHTESIVTDDWDMGQRFLREVDSSVVLVNASTRFADGGELGLGAEIGISTTRMHAYGPMGLKELTTTKFIVMGEGQIRT